MSSDSDYGRREFLKAAGGAAATATIAGCSGGGGGDGGGDTETATPAGTETEPATETTTSEDGMQPEGTLVFSRGSHSATLDPQQTTSGEDVKVTNQIFNQLIQFAAGGGGKLEAGLATDYSLSGTTASLTLREGVKFHNGDEFTAKDFKATYRRFVDSGYQYYIGDENQSAYGSFTLGSWIKSIDASQKYELQIELKQKYAPFLRNLAMFASSVLSRKQIKSLGDSQGDLGRKPIGTGPFKLEQLDDSNQRVLLTANTNYWGEGPKLAKVVFNTIGSNSTRAQSLINGDSHIIDGIGAQASKQIQDAGSATLLEKDGINIGYMAFNMARFEPFRKKKVRQAISYAVNTKAIVESIYEGFARQADQPIPPNVLGYNDDLDPYPTDKQKAQQLLVEAGHGDGFSFELATFKNPRGYNPSPIQTAEQVRSDLGEIGIDVTIKQMSFSPFLDYTLQGKHDACFLGWYTDNADPDNFFYALLHPQVEKSKIPEGQDWIGWDNIGNALDVAAWANRDFMDLVEQGQSTYNTSKRKSLYRDASKLAHDEAPWVYIDYAKTLEGIHQSVKKNSYTLSSIGGPYLNTVVLK